MIRGLRRSKALLTILRAASWSLLTGLALTFIGESLSAPVTAIALGRLVDSASSAIAVDWTHTVPSLAFFAGALLVGHVSTAISTPLSAAVAASVDGSHRRTVSEAFDHVRDFRLIEDPETRTLLRETIADPSKGYEATPAKGAIAELRWDLNALGVLAGALVVGSFAWWLVPISIVPALFNRWLRARHAFDIAGLWRFASAHELGADALRNAATSLGEAKDIRLFGIRNWLVNKMQHEIETANRPLWNYTMRLVRAEWNQFALGAIGLLPITLVVTSAALNGETTVGTATMVISAAWRCGRR